MYPVELFGNSVQLKKNNLKMGPGSTQAHKK